MAECSGPLSVFVLAAHQFKVSESISYLTNPFQGSYRLGEIVFKDINNLLKFNDKFHIVKDRLHIFRDK